MPDPSDIQRSLGALLSHVEQDQRLSAEMARARREFFGAEMPEYAGGDRESWETAAVRFAEWYLLERESEVLGEVPISRFGAQLEVDDALVELLGSSTVGVFLVEAAHDDPVRVRDLQDGTRLEVGPMAERVDPGDVLIGRLYDEGSMHVPSLATTVVRASPHLAVAFQRELRALELDRRLHQSEIEHLLVRRFAEREQAAATPPLERLEAELQGLLEEAGAADAYPAAAVSLALRHAEAPGGVIGPIMDQLAFDTEADLDRLRRLLVEIWNAHQTLLQRQQHEQEQLEEGAAERGDNSRSRTPGARPARPDARRGGSKPASKPPAAPPDPSAPLGERLAARIDEGLAAGENVDALFADVDRMFGEETGEEIERDEVGSGDGDLEPLAHEFVWEQGLGRAEEAELAAFVRTQREAPVPRTELEYLDADDLLRHLLKTWLQAEPAKRLATLRASFGLLERFAGWARETQGYELTDALRGARAFLDEGERLQRASLVLSTTEELPDTVGRPTLLRVETVDEDAARVLVGTDERSARLRMPNPSGARDLAPGDYVVAMLGAGFDDPDEVAVSGVAVVVSGRLEHLLG